MGEPISNVFTYSCLSITGYLEAMPSPSLLENRVNQFLQLGGSQPPATTIPPTTTSITTAPVITTPAQYPQVSGSETDIVKQALDLALGTSGESHSPHQPRTTVSINPELPALPSKLLQRIWVDEYIDLPSYLRQKINRGQSRTT